MNMKFINWVRNIPPTVIGWDPSRLERTEQLVQPCPQMT